MPLIVPNAITQICAYQKDEYYINSLKGILLQAVKSILGENFSLMWSKEVNVLADVVYYTLTTVGSLQTLGEEYTNIIQVNSTFMKTPSWTQRIILIYLHSLFPFLLEKILNYYETKLINYQIKHLSDKNQARLYEALPKIKTLLITAHRLHLSLFYIQKMYFTIAKRITCIKYVKYTVNSSNQSKSFSILGKLSFMQSVLMIILQLKSLHSELFSDFWQKKSSHYSLKKPTSLFGTDHNQLEHNKCSLCLEILKNSSVTSCGHLFCWSCIHESIFIKRECPLCRENILPNQIVLLKNF